MHRCTQLANCRLLVFVQAIQRAPYLLDIFLMRHHSMLVALAVTATDQAFLRASEASQLAMTCITSGCKQKVLCILHQHPAVCPGQICLGSLTSLAATCKGSSCNVTRSYDKCLTLQYDHNQAKKLNLCQSYVGSPTFSTMIVTA